MAFTSGSDAFTVTAAGECDLDFLPGDDIHLTLPGGIDSFTAANLIM